MRKMTEAEKVDKEATALYDQLNPNWEREIKTSKADCIKIVEKRRDKRRERLFRTTVK